ncbi:MAG: FUSC family protein [Terracidiphilus sp.]
MGTQQIEQPNAGRSLSNVGKAIRFAATLAAACMLSYWLITSILTRAFNVSRDNNLLGGMWSVIATIFVFRHRLQDSTHAAASRLLATLLSFLLCLIYFPFFPLNVPGLAVLILIGTIILDVCRRQEDIVTAAITTTVVFVVAKISPGPAWQQPILRLVDTTVGIAVGVLAARIISLWFTDPFSQATAAELSTPNGVRR